MKREALKDAIERLEELREYARQDIRGVDGSLMDRSLKQVQDMIAKGMSKTHPYFAGETEGNSRLFK